jgi:hypothetical protein
LPQRFDEIPTPELAVVPAPLRRRDPYFVK